MDFLNKSVSQILDLFRSMTIGMRITSALLLVIIMTSLVYLFAVEIQSGNDYLFGAREFSQAELDAMQQAFAAADLDEFEVVGYRIRVPRRNRYLYLQALAQSNFTPENFDSALDEALSGSSPWFEPKELRELKVQHATQKKLAQVISAIAGIEKATVQFHEERLGGFPPKVEKSATVAVAASGRRPLDADLVRAVRKTASNWFNIPPENTVVTDLIGGRTYSGTRDFNENGAADTAYADTKKMYERDWKERILERLSMYPGIIAAVNVELEPELNNESQKVTYDPQSTAVESSSFTKTTETRPNAAGRPGAVPNQVSSNTPRAIPAGSQQQTTADENRENQVSVAGHEQTTIKKAPLTPKNVTASIGVPRSLYRKIWQQQQERLAPTPAGQTPKQPTSADLAKIEKETISSIETALVNLVPAPPAGVNPYPNVQVTSYDDLPPEPIAAPGTASVALAWLGDNWRTLALVGLGIFSLLFLRGMVRSANAQAGTVPSAAPLMPQLSTPATQAQEVAEEPVSAPMLARHRSSGGTSLRDELTVLVKDDPDAAANVLRTWIGEVA